MFDINKVYNFNTLVPSVLGGEFRSMRVKGTMTAEIAAKYRDVYTLHSQLVNFLPGLPRNPNDCTYILFEDTNKNSVVLAVEYINISSIIAVNSVNLRVTVNDITTGDINIIRNRFLELGYSNIVIETL